MRPPKFCRNRSNGRRVMAFPIFSNLAASAILNLKSFSIWSYDCHCVPNLLLYTKFHQNWVTRSASIGRRRGNSIMADMSGTHTMGCDHPSFIQIGPLAGNLSHFQYFPTRQPFAIFNLKKIIFGHMAVIVFLICCRVPIFIKIGSRVRPPDAHRLTTKCSVRGC